MSLAFYFFTRLKKEEKNRKKEKTTHNRDDFKWYKVAFQRIHDSDLSLFQHDMYCSISLTLTLILMPHHLLPHLFAKLPFHLFLLYSQCQPPFFAPLWQYLHHPLIRTEKHLESLKGAARYKSLVLLPQLIKLL